MILFLYQSKCVLKIIEFALSRQLNDLNRSNLYFGHVAEWLRRGLQILESQFASGRCLQKNLVLLLKKSKLCF